MWETKHMSRLKTEPKGFHHVFICVVYILMTKWYSPRMSFKHLTGHFLDNIPKTLILYGNSCNLSEIV